MLAIGGFYMKNRKVIRFEYFRVRIHNDHGSGYYDLSQWIESIINQPLEQRRTIIRGYPSRLETCELLEENYYYLRFIKMTDSFLPELAYDDKESVPLELDEDEYIAYDVNAVFDIESCVLMLQNSKGSLSANGIRDYILDIGHKFGVFNENDTITFDCIMNDVDLSFFNNSTIKKMEIRFENLRSSNSYFENGSSISNILKTVKDTGGNTAVLTIGLGKGRTKDFLNNDNAEKLLISAFERQDCLSGAKVFIKDDNEIRPYDLINNILRDIWTFELDSKTSLSFITIRNKMLNLIKNKTFNTFG